MGELGSFSGVRTSEVGKVRRWGSDDSGWCGNDPDGDGDCSSGVLEGLFWKGKGGDESESCRLVWTSEVGEVRRWCDSGCSNGVPGGLLLEVEGRESGGGGVMDPSFGRFAGELVDFPTDSGRSCFELFADSPAEIWGFCFGAILLQRRINLSTIDTTEYRIERRAGTGAHPGLSPGGE